MSSSSNSITCPRCGNVNRYTADECIKCGLPLGPAREAIIKASGSATIGSSPSSGQQRAESDSPSPSGTGWRPSTSEGQQAYTAAPLPPESAVPPVTPSTPSEQGAPSLNQSGRRLQILILGTIVLGLSIFLLVALDRVSRGSSGYDIVSNERVAFVILVVDIIFILLLRRALRRPSSGN